MRLLLIRHGRTPWNAEGRYQGRTDVPLDEVGRAEAEALARGLADERPAALVVSPLRRAVDTAAPLAAIWGLEPQVEPALVEMDFGAWEGLTHAEAAARDGALLAAWWADPEALAPPDGETAGQVASRVMALHERIAGRYADATVALVSHVAPIKCLLLTLLELPLWRQRQLYLERGSVTIVDVRDGSAVLMAFGRTFR